MAAARRAEVLDRRWLNGAVNGIRHSVVGASWLAGIFDLLVVDRVVGRFAHGVEASARALCRVQAGFAPAVVVVAVVGTAVFLGLVFIVNL